MHVTGFIHKYLRVQILLSSLIKIKKIIYLADTDEYVKKEIDSKVRN